MTNIMRKRKVNLVKKWGIIAHENKNHSGLEI